MPSNAGFVVLSKMLFCTLGIYGSFFTWSFLQERIATHKYLVDGVEQRFRFVFFLNTMQSLCALVVGLLTHGIMLAISSKGAKRSETDTDTPTSPTTPLSKSFPVARFIMIGFSATFASPFGYAAMQRISYPMVLTVKMCKMVPIIAIGALWHRRKYSTIKYVDCLLITMGVVGFTVFGEHDEEKSTTSSVLGVILVMINLFFDGYTNSTQDEVVKRNGFSGTAMMTFTNMSIAFWSLVALIVFEVLPPNPVTKPEFFAALRFVAQQPAALHDVVIMGMLNAVGQFFIFQTIALFGTLTVTALTVTRKVGSVLISIFAHNHSVSFEQWIALSAIILGIFLDAYINVQEKKAKDHAAYVKKHEEQHANDPVHHHHKHKRHHLHEVQRHQKEQ